MPYNFMHYSFTAHSYLWWLVSYLRVATAAPGRSDRSAAASLHYGRKAGKEKSQDVATASRSPELNQTEMLRWHFKETVHI